MVVIIFVLCIIAVAALASPSGDGTSYISTNIVDYDKSKVVISLVSLLGILGVALKLGMEIKTTQLHIKDDNRHLTPEERETFLKTMTEEKCAIKHDEFKTELKAFRSELATMNAMMSRIDERTEMMMKQKT